MKRAAVTLRTADPSQARKLHALITANLEEGRLLPRTRGELDAHADRFTIALRGRTIVGCAELAPLSPVVAPRPPTRRRTSRSRSPSAAASDVRRSEGATGGLRVGSNA